MPGENLTRIEAAERKAVVQTHSYEVKLDLTTGPEVFRSETKVTFSATPGASTFIDFITKTVHSVKLNGAELDVAAVSDGVRIQLPGLQASNTLVVIADALYTNTGEGLHRFVDPVDGEVYLYSQFEVPDSRRVFAVFEQPDLKASFQFTVTTPSDWTVISNSPTPEPIFSGPIDGESLKDSVTYVFDPTPVLSSYITAIIAGPYRGETSELTSADGRTIPLGVYARKSLVPYLDADYIFEKTRQGFAFYEAKFGYPYPFAKYDQVFVPEFNAGAMENAGAVTHTEAYVFRSKVTDAVRERRVVTILHELAHMWFGDLVTMKWWNDLWLNESFAEYASTLATAEATEWAEAWATFASTEKSWAYNQDQLPSTHPIVADIRDLEDVQVNFDGITYAKGASVLKQLVAWVGQGAFLAGVHEYFVKHEYSNTELVDLLSELEKTSGRDLADWSQKWLETAGVNTLRPEFSVDADGRFSSFAVLQSAAPDYPTIRPHRLAIGFYTLTDDTLSRTHRVELDVDGERTEVAELVGLAQPDLILLNDDDLAYAKIRLDERSLQTVIAHLGKIDSELARSIVWGAVWDATRDAEAKASDFVQLVLNNVGAETGSTTMRTALNQLVLSVGAYVAPAKQEAQGVAAADGVWNLAQQAEPGSDAQFQFVKVFAQLARTDAQLAIVAGLRDGSVTLPGLEVDTDLGWELLQSLVVGGKAGSDEIDAALAGDNTASGNQAAAHARAALPTPEGKAAAWASVVEQEGAPNLIVRATGAGFQRAHDTALLKPYIAKYFDSLRTIWDTRSYAIAAGLINGLYPFTLASQELADATREWVDANPEPAALRRLVVENLARVERALKVQAADA
ncbi:aminopeptidase N [Gryllotalpicola protaetiae]|uniref:Aminopeptidase N n=1 Tax=Gryllotalpicola protaetiae TaxID=2419771 RepID=A0A387BVK0_9MICO|nr:aminopeptidase N [Gryllotalpicola protaetiae]AYG05150.1 aminopeptidase N [Gryllotalpicola protaetiae]